MEGISNHGCIRMADEKLDVLASQSNADDITI